MLSVRIPLTKLNILAFPSLPHDCMGNQRPWYVQPYICAIGHIQNPMPLIEKRRGLTVSRWLVSIEIHRIEVTRPCFSRPARKLRHWVAPSDDDAGKSQAPPTKTSVVV